MDMEKFSSFLIVLLLMLTSFTAGAQEYPRGDVNQDGAVNISDVTCLIDNLLKGVPEGDVDQDGSVNISDVTSLIDYLLKGSWSDDPVTPPDSHEWVDLGLPSGTLWATCNVGANSPEERGDYFAWGETSPKEKYGYNTYKWCDCSFIPYHLTKYNTDSKWGVVDNKTELEPEDDAAYVNWGPSWRMPTKEQIIELRGSCTWQWTNRNGLRGQLVTGPNGNTLFLPAAGFRRGKDNIDFGSYGHYWSRVLDVTNPFYTYCLRFDYSGSVSWLNLSRNFGRSVRAVRVP